MSEALEAYTDKVSVEWKIKYFFTLAEDRNSYIFSPSFLLSNEEWYIKIYPNRHTENDSVGSVSMFLRRLTSSSRNHCVSYTIGIKKWDGSTFKSLSETSEFEEENNLSSGCEEIKLLRTSELLVSKDILSLDNSLIIFCTARGYSVRRMDIVSVGKTISQATTAGRFRKSESDKILQENWKDLLLNSSDADVTLKVKNQEFKAHSWVLVARSSVFYAMLDYATEQSVINIDGCDPNPFKDMLYFLYTGELDVVSSTNAVDLYKIAYKFDLKDLRSECVRRATDTPLTVESFCDVVSVIAVNKNYELSKHVKDFYVANRSRISQSALLNSLKDVNYSLYDALFCAGSMQDFYESDYFAAMKESAEE